VINRFPQLFNPIYIVCDLSKIDNRGCLDALDLNIEIVSPKKSELDLKDKFEICLEHGVRE
jgi:Uma2 family endonuclease